MKHFYKTIITIFFLFSISLNTFAAEIKIQSENNNPALEQEFYLDLVLDTGSVSINGIEGSVSFDSEMISFVRSENSKSFITHWINSPAIFSPNVIKFAGITPNGFAGFLNNLKPDESGSGNITRLIFRPIKSGETFVNVENSIVTLNDGEGTINEIKKISKSINISNNIKKESYNTFDTKSPELTAEIVTDQNLYNNQKTLVFNAIDKESGIQGVYLKAGKEWLLITNPFLLNQDDLRGVLTIKAVDFAGNDIVKRFFLPGYSKNVLYITLGILGLIILWALRFFYRIYAKNKI